MTVKELIDKLQNLSNNLMGCKVFDTSGSEIIDFVIEPGSEIWGDPDYIVLETNKEII